MKALITGCNGFAGRHLAVELRSHDYDVHGIDITAHEDSICLDLLNIQAMCKYMLKVKPDIIFHLAAQANVGLSWKIPQKTYGVNVLGTLNLLEAVKQAENSCRIILVGSSDQYGVTGLIEKPISEATALNPSNPYSASKKAQEEIAAVYKKAYDMDIVLTRSFNHSGPGQGLGFLIPDLCSEIVKVESGTSKFLKVGNLEVTRDFSDVREIVKAYRLLGEKGQSGEVYNVGSGIGRKAQDILDLLLEMAKCEIPVQQDESRMRKSDTPVLICDNTKIKIKTGWKHKISIKKTLKDTLEYYRENF